MTEKTTDYKTLLFNENVQTDKYKDHLIEQYKLYVEMADRLSLRRFHANTFFLSLNTGLVAILGYLKSIMTAKDFSSTVWIISMSGVILCYMWYRLIKSYKDINTAKFSIIHEIEKKLPISPYKTEWEMVEKGENPQKYLPFTHIEIYIPWIFLIIHFFVIINYVLTYKIVS